MTPVAPRSVNDVSFVRRINHERYFAVQRSTGVELLYYRVVLE